MIAAMSLSGCMSFNKAGEVEIADILALINEGRHEELTAISTTPFLLDSEILQGTALTGSFWSGLSTAEFTMTAPEIIRNAPSTDDDAGLFGENTEVNAFFSKYLAPNPIIIEIASNEGLCVLILTPDKNGRKKIAAWGGPY